MTEVTTSSYWIADNALYIKLNANGNPDYLLGNTTAGAYILCYIKGIDGLEYDAGHNYRRWSLSLSPTCFNTTTTKYVYVAIPRPTNILEQAFVVFPSEKIDIYGQNKAGTQIGSTEYYYIWLQGIITATNAGRTQPREWEQRIDTGTLSSDEALTAGGDNTWWRYSTVDDAVTFLKEIYMEAKSFFHNLRINNKEVTDVAVSADNPSKANDTTVATTGYVKENYLSRSDPDTANGLITFLSGLKVGSGGNYYIDENAKARLVDMIISAIQGESYTGADILADRGFGMWQDANGRSTVITDYLITRVKQYATEIEVRKATFTAGDINISGAGSHIMNVVPIDRDGNIMDVVTVDSVAKVRHKTREYMTAGGVRVAVKGRSIVRSSEEYTDYNESDVYAWRCYETSDDGTTAVNNLWVVGDQAYCQSFNIREGVYQNVQNKYYWRLVVKTGRDVLEDGMFHNYVDLANKETISSVTDRSYGVYADLWAAWDAAGSSIEHDFIGFDNLTRGRTSAADVGDVRPAVFTNDIPDIGDDIAQLGSQIDTNRTGLIRLVAVGTQPSIGIYYNIHDYSPLSDALVTFLSPKKVYMRASSFEWISNGHAGDGLVLSSPVCDRGDWVRGNGINYGRYDLVQHKGSSWLCIVALGTTTTTEPGTTAGANDWKVYAAKGEQGDPPKTYQITCDYPRVKVLQDGSVYPLNGLVELKIVEVKDGVYAPPEIDCYWSMVRGGTAMGTSPDTTFGVEVDPDSEGCTVRAYADAARSQQIGEYTIPVDRDGMKGADGTSLNPIGAAVDVYDEARAEEYPDMDDYWTFVSNKADRTKAFPVDVTPHYWPLTGYVINLVNNKVYSYEGKVVDSGTPPLYIKTWSFSHQEEELSAGDSYIVDLSAQQVTDGYHGHLYFFNNNSEWVDMGKAVGDDGLYVGFDPQSGIIVTEVEAGDNVSYNYDNARAYVVARQGVNTLVPSAVSITYPNTIAAQRVKSGNDYYIQVTGVNSTTITTARITVTVTVANTTVTLYLNVYINRLGTVKEAVKNDVYERISSKTIYDADGTEHAMMSAVKQDSGSYRVVIYDGSGNEATSFNLDSNGNLMLDGSTKVVISNDGKTAAVFQDGKVNMSLLNAAQIIANGINANTVNANGATFNNLNIGGNSTFRGVLSIMKALTATTAAERINISGDELPTPTSPVTMPHLYIRPEGLLFKAAANKYLYVNVSSSGNFCFELRDGNAGIKFDGKDTIRTYNSNLGDYGGFQARQFIRRIALNSSTYSYAYMTDSVIITTCESGQGLLQLPTISASALNNNESVILRIISRDRTRVVPGSGAFMRMVGSPANRDHYTLAPSDQGTLVYDPVDKIWYIGEYRGG